jgi:hypothetical protein
MIAIEYYDKFIPKLPLIKKEKIEFKTKKDCHLLIPYANVTKKNFNY